MLKQLRRLEKTRSIIILFFAALLVLSLVVAGLYTRAGTAAANPFKSREVLATVNGDNVTVAYFNMRKKVIEQGGGGRYTPAQMGYTDERILDTVINDRIALQEAERLNLLPSAEEVRDQIRKQFTAPGVGFDFNRYKQAVTQNFGSVSLFEEFVRDGVALKKLEAYVTAGAQVSEQEVQQEYQRQNTSFDLVYVPVSVTQLAARINPSDDEVARYFEEHKTDYRFFQPQKNIRYLFISQEKVGKKLQVTDEELRQSYNELRPEQKLAGVRVQQIVLKVAKPELDQQVLQEASQLVASLRGDDPGVSEQEFADAARGKSQDPATANNGGWLPNIVRRNPNNKRDLAQSVFDLQPGQVSEPMKTGNAYYIFRRGDGVEKSFEEARPELLASASNRRAYSVASQIAARAVARLKETKDVQQVAQEFAAEANMTPAEMVKETGLIKPGDNVTDIGSSPQFEEAIAPLNEPGDVGSHVGVKNGFAVPVLVEKREPRIPELQEVRGQVVEAVRNERARTQLEQTARELAQNAANPDSLKAAAEKLGLTAETAPAYKLGMPLGQAGTDPALDETIFGLKQGEVTKSPVKVGDAWVVAGVTKRTEADMAEFGKQRDTLVQSAQMERRNQVFEDYLAAMRSRLERAGDIEIKEDVFKRISEADEPPIALPRGGGGIPGLPAGLPISPGGGGGGGDR